MPEGTASDDEFVELARLKPIFDCMSILTTGWMPDWWFGILSTRTVIRRSGRLGLAGEEVGDRVDLDELALCRSLAAKAEKTGAVPISSEGECDFHRFFAAAVVGEAVPEKIDEALIRARFGGTILPIATVRVQPLDEASPWWAEMTRYIGDRGALDVARPLSERGLSADDDLKAEGEEANTRAVRSYLRQLSLIRLLTGPEFRDAAFVAIGEPDAPPPKRWPAGLEQWPSQFPRLFVGLTHGGSLAGVVTYVVHT